MDWTAILPHVLPSVPACADEVALAHVVRATRDFCAQTWAWNHQCDSFNTVINVPVYALQLDAGEELVRLLGLSVDGCKYEMTNAYGGREKLRRSSGERFAFINSPKEITLNPAPTASGLDIIADVAVKPTMDALEFPDELAEYVTDIAYGAVASLLMVPKQDWTDMSAAGVSLGLFRDRIATVAHQVRRGFGNARERAVLEFF